MTAIDWLIEQLIPEDQHEGIMDIIEEAKEMEKQQIIDAFGVGCHLESKRLIGYHDVAEQHYNETYGSNKKIKFTEEEWAELNNGSKGSDEEKTNSQRFDEFMQLVTSSQTEISDEEIEKVSNTLGDDYYASELIMWEKGAKWYREQLKQL